jgi:hypothetical protein
VNVEDPIGTNLWSRPISPFAGGKSATELVVANNIELLYKLSKGWRGKIKLYIQSAMNNKQQVKLRLLSLYNPSRDISTGKPVYSTVLNAPSHFMEFTAGGQIHEVELPFLSRNEIIQTTKDMNLDALYHGEYYIYLAQKMALSGDSPQDIYFNVYYSCEDVDLFGYGTEYGFIGPIARSQEMIEEVPVFRNESKLKVMNEPQDQRKILKVDRSGEENVYDRHRLTPLTHVRDIIRRMYKTRNPREMEIQPMTTRYTSFRVSQYLGEGANSPNTASPLELALRMYYGKSVGLKFRTIVSPIRGDQSMDGVKITAMYLPPEYCFSTALHNIDEAGVNENDPMFLGTSEPLPNYPIPFTRQVTDFVAEFEVPNLSPMKFIGCPSKMTNVSANDMSQAAAGFILVGVQNNTGQVLNVNIQQIVGCTDESRVGFHTMAPVVNFSAGESTQNTLYADILSNPFSNIRNSYLYYTRS